MRCLSPHERYSIQVIEEVTHRGPDKSGTIVEWNENKPVIADFFKTGLLDHEIEAALESFNFSGIPEGVNPLTRVSVFDSEAYCQQWGEDPEKQQVMQEKIDLKLRKLQAKHPNEFIIVEQPASQKPWPSYDEATVEEVVEWQSKLGIPAEDVRLYEVENQNRSEVVEAMERLEDPEGAEAKYGPAADQEPVTVDV